MEKSGATTATTLHESSALFCGTNLYVKNPKEEEDDELVRHVVVNGDHSEVPDSAGVDEYNEEPEDDHPKIPGWFSEYCPVWPGAFHSK